MSDILIKGMELPKGNDYLHLIIQNGKVHKAISCGHLTTDEMNVAEAVELPSHGKLKDTDIIINTIRKATKDAFGKGDTLRYGYLSDIIDMIEKSPTILEASEVVE